MALPRSGSDESGTQAASSFWAESAQSAKAWAAVAAAFFAVVTLAFFLFSRHQTERQLQLNAQYAQNAARFAQQLELKYQNYRAVVDNVTRILSEAGASAISIRQHALESAQQAQQRAAAREKELEARVKVAVARKKQADEAVKLRGSVDASAKQRADVRAKAYADAEQGFQDALQATTSAKQASLNAAAALLNAQNKLDVAEGRLKDAQRTVETARAESPTSLAPGIAPPSNPAPVATLASSEPAPIPLAAPAPRASGVSGAPGVPASASASGSVAAPVPASASPVASASPGQGVIPQAGSVAPSAAEINLSKALSNTDAKKNAAELAREAVEVAREAFEGAQQKEALAWSVASKRDAEAQQAWLELEISNDARELAKQAKSAAEQQSAQAKTTQKVSVDQYQLGLTQKAERDAAVVKASSVTPTVEADHYLKGLEALVLPSHVQQLRQCQGMAGLAAVKLCVAQRIAELNEVQSTERGLEIVQCSSSSSSASVSEDGRYLFLPPSGRESEPSAVPPACGRVEVRRLLAGAEDPSGVLSKQTAEGAFEGVLLLRRDGTTLHSLDMSSNLRVVALPGFEDKYMDASRVLSKLAIGTSEYRAFLQPIRLKLAPPGSTSETAAPASRERADLVLCGLALESRLSQASYAIALPYYLWFVIFLGVGLLALPLAKLWLLGPKTNFTRFDVTLLGTSTALLTLLGPVVILAFVAHNRLEARAERQVAHVATDLEQRLRAQITTAAQRLRGFHEEGDGRKLHAQLLERTSDVGLAAQRAECSAAGGTLTRSIFFEGGEHAKSVCERTSFQLPESSRVSEAVVERAVPAADWKLIFFMDRAGDERVKFGPESRTSTPVSLKNRGYFRRALAGTPSCLEASCAIRGTPELVRSITSGRLVLMVAQPICASSYPCKATADQEPRLGVAALQTEMEAFRSLALPLGMQLAVVDETGRIMLHSNNDAHHEQNLFGEVDQPDELRASLLAEVPETLHLNYLGQLSRLHIEPLRLPGSGWSVITIAPNSIVDVATTDMVLASLFGYGMLLLLLLLLLLCLLVGRQAIKWFVFQSPSRQVGREAPGIGLRPHAQRSEAYAELGVWALLSGAALCLLAMFSAPYLPTSVGLLIALLLCAVALHKLLKISQATPLSTRSAGTRPGQKTMRPWRQFLPLTYTLCIAGLAEVFIMAPAAVLFNGAYTHVVANLVRAEQHHLAGILTRRHDCLGALPGPDGKSEVPGGCSNLFPSGEERASSLKPVIASTFLQSRVLSPLPYLADFLPAIGPADLDDRGRLYRAETIGRPKPAPSELVSERQPASMTLVSPQNGFAQVESELPPLFGIQYRWLTFVMLLLVAAAALAAAYAVAFKSLRRLYFLDLLMQWRERVVHDVKSLVAETERRAGKANQRKILIRHPLTSVLEELANTAGAHTIQLDAAGSKPPSVGAPDALWLVQDLRPRNYDVETVRRLAQVSRWPAQVIVLTVNDPSSESSEDLCRLWAGVLERFDVMEVATSAQNAQQPPLSSDDAPVQAPCSPRVMRAWLESSVVERRLLAQLAINGYATPHPANIPALKTLATRGLLNPDTLTITDVELERVSREATSPEEQASWADADRSTAWASLRVPLSTGVLALLAALTASKPELGVASAIVPTLAAGLPTVLKILAQMVASKSEA